MTTVLAPPAPLPPTIGHQHVSIRLFCPLLGTRLTMFFAEGDIAVDAQQLVDLTRITAPDTFYQFPVQWVHEWTPAPEARPVEVYLWRRDEAIAAVMSLCPDSEFTERFAEWLERQHQDFYADFQETLDLCLRPVRAATDGTEYSVSGAAKNLAARFGSAVTRTYLFQRMAALGWIERDLSAASHGHWKVSLETRALRDAPVYSRTVKVPGGTYEQVFLNEHGISNLVEDLRAQLQPGLFEGAQL